jgi:dodecin
MLRSFRHGRDKPGHDVLGDAGDEGKRRSTASSSGLPHSAGGGSAMQEHVYKIIQLAGSSDKSIEDAVQTAIQRASKTLKNLRWFEIVETRGHIENGRVAHYQVALKVGFTLDD